MPAQEIFDKSMSKAPYLSGAMYGGAIGGACAAMVTHFLTPSSIEAANKINPPYYEDVLPMLNTAVGSAGFSTGVIVAMVSGAYFANKIEQQSPQPTKYSSAVDDDKQFIQNLGMFVAGTPILGATVNALMLLSYDKVETFLKIVTDAAEPAKVLIQNTLHM